MQKVFFLCFFLSSVAIASAQLTSQQITGEWRMIVKHGERTIETRRWSFSNNGTGSYSMNSDVRNRICATSEQFTYRIQGDSIFISPLVRKEGCKEKRNEDDEVQTQKVETKPSTWLIYLEAKDKLYLGGYTFTRN